jgi:hypothetical protein
MKGLRGPGGRGRRRSFVGKECFQGWDRFAELSPMADETAKACLGFRKKPATDFRENAKGEVNKTKVSNFLENRLPVRLILTAESHNPHKQRES